MRKFYLNIVKEAFNEKGLTESDWIRVKRPEGGHMEVNYKELYDCFSGLDKEGKYHPSNKEISGSLGGYFVEEVCRREYFNFLGEMMKSLSNLSVGDVKVGLGRKRLSKRDKSSEDSSMVA